MANANRTTRDAVELEKALAKEPHRFGFFNAMRALECAYRARPRIGTSRRPREDPVRLGQQPHLEFAPTTLAAFEPRENNKPARLTGFFFGMFGPDGPLPLHLTEFAIQRIRFHRDATFARFVDMFHHRLISLFYRAWANARPTVSYDRPEEDRFSAYVASLIGLGIPALRDRDAMPDRAKLFYAGHFACHTRHAEGLAATLGDYFQVPATIQEFCPAWVTLPVHCRLHLGDLQGMGILGETATIGARVWDCQHKFRVVFGPMGLSDYVRMIPSGEALVRLTAVIRNYAGAGLDWDLNLVLKRDEVPAAKLGEFGELGWTTWLGTRHEKTDASDMIINPASALARKRATKPGGDGLETTADLAA